MKGQRIANTRETLDAYGFRLCAVSIAGDGWRDRHDKIKWRLHEDLRSCGALATTEVCVLFAPLLPQAARSDPDAQPRRKRQGIVPDMLVPHFGGEVVGRDALVDFKMLHFAPSKFSASAQSCRAVMTRAGAINREYVRKGAALDA